MKAGFVHIVYFWLKSEVTEAEKVDFEKGVHTLMEIDLIQMSLVGPPAMTPRSVVDNSYHYAIMSAFASKEDHDAYQTHPDHDIFIENHKDKWERVQVYDHIPAGNTV